MEGARKFASDYGLYLDTDPEGTRGNLKFYDIGLAEIIPLPTSSLFNKTVGQLDYLKVGGTLQLVMGGLMILLIPIFFPF
ncbi:MAG: hypothetical protein J6C44_03935 [Muribaculaceae bacterium]|nr:hypothetical protein [Muribaculaceae bacterium]